MEIYRKSESAPFTFGGYYDAIQRARKGSLEKFLKILSNEEDLQYLMESSKRYHDETSIYQVLKMIVEQHLTEKDMESILAYAITYGDLFRSDRTHLYLMHLFEEYDMSENICRILYKYMTVDKTLSKEAYCEDILKSKNFPPELLADALKYGKSSIAEWAAINPNCPPDAKIKWMQETGKIAKEDELYHKIEEVPQTQDDEFGKLQQLVSNSKFKIYRKSEIDWDSLARKLEKEMDDPKYSISLDTEREIRQLLKNPNCPAHILDKFANRLFEQIMLHGERRVLDINEAASVALFENPNLPSDIFYKILEIPDMLSYKGSYGGFKTVILRLIVDNPSCPKDIIDYIFKMADVELVELILSNMNGKNISIEKSLQIRRDRGIIEKEDTNKHQLEEVPQTQDNSMDELKGLLAKLKGLITKTSGDNFAAPMDILLLNFLDRDHYDNETIELFFQKIKDPISYHDIEAKLGIPIGQYIDRILRMGDVKLSDNSMRTIIEISIRFGDIFRTYGSNNFTRTLLSIHPNFPKDVFEELYGYIKEKKIKDNSNVADIITNEHLPKEIIEDALFNPVHHEWIAEWAADNPNCPVESKIKFMKQRGFIQTENPKVHKLEEVPRQNDNDFEQLQKLVSNSKFTIYRKSELSFEDEFKKQEAQLKLNGHSASINVRTMLKNPLCPVYILEKYANFLLDFLSGKETNVSNPPSPRGQSVFFNEFQNPHLPETYFYKWMNDLGARKHRYYSTVAEFMVDNPNCPSDVLEFILFKIPITWLKEAVMEHPNMLPETVIKWRRENNEIKTEDPNVHKLEEVPQTQDSDFEQLQNLVKE